MEPTTGEIRLWAASFAPKGWTFCDGTLLHIVEHKSLYWVIGTTYGGDGKVTFAVPDLRGRVPVHVGPGYTLGQPGGTEGVTLTAANLPAHEHAVNVAMDGATETAPEGMILGATDGIDMYASAAPTLTMQTGAISDSIMPRSGQPYGTPSPRPHENMQPFQCINYIICLDGKPPLPF